MYPPVDFLGSIYRGDFGFGVGGWREVWGSKRGRNGEVEQWGQDFWLSLGLLLEMIRRIQISDSNQYPCY